MISYLEMIFCKNGLVGCGSGFLGLGKQGFLGRCFDGEHGRSGSLGVTEGVTEGVVGGVGMCLIYQM